MLAYIARRIVTLIPILFLISLVSFIIIQLPPGDWVTRQINQLKLSGIQVDEGEALRLTQLYGLDKPGGERYINWMKGILLEGNFGWSFQWNQPVNSLLAERIPLTMSISIASLIISWIIAIPIGIYSATHQYSVLDYIFTFIGFIGLATPGFLVALVLAWFIFANTGFSPLGLYSNAVPRCTHEHSQIRRYAEAPDAAAADHWIEQHGCDHPRHARESARRVEEAIRHHRARQGLARVGFVDQVSGAHGYQPDHQHGRLGVCQA